jgi:hypothetical protein
MLQQSVFPMAQVYCNVAGTSISRLTTWGGLPTLEQQKKDVPFEIGAPFNSHAIKRHAIRQISTFYC